MRFLSIPTVIEAFLKAVGTLVEVGVVSHAQQSTERTHIVFKCRVR